MPQQPLHDQQPEELFKILDTAQIGCSVTRCGHLIHEGAWQARVCARSARYGLILAARADTSELSPEERWRELSRADGHSQGPLTSAGGNAARIAAQAAFDELLDLAIALGGTVTGEHGVGLLKRDGMRRKLDPGPLVLQGAVRQALDPLGIFNPSKG